MDTRQQQSLDRYITGNYGEDQLRNEGKQKMKRMELNDTQRNTISHGLRIAAERYDEHAATLSELAGGLTRPVIGLMAQNYVALADTFHKQARDARQLASLFDECETVRCESCTEIESFSG
jgi:hypothetical protein